MRTRCMFSSFLLVASLIPLATQPASAKNLHVIFPQIAVGDEYNTILDLTNIGTETFQGTIEIRHIDNIMVNGQPTTLGRYSVTISPGASKRYVLTRSGATQAGFAIIYDDKLSLSDMNLNQQINGTAIFQYKDGTSLLDSIGVPAGDQDQHFCFMAENTSGAWTGLALADASGYGADVILTAFSESGQYVDAAQFGLNEYGHEGFFLYEKLSLPPEFIGRVEVESSGSICPLALRMEGTQYSTISIMDVTPVYDFLIVLSDNRSFSGELLFGIKKSSTNGWVRWQSPTPDLNYEVRPMSGFVIQDGFGAVITGQFNANFCLFMLECPYVYTNRDSLSGLVIYIDDAQVPIDGILVGAKRE